jgi:hypothetical protein
MHHEKGFAGMVEVEVTQFTDLRGRAKQFIAARCPSPECKAKGSMILALRGLEPAHFTQEQALELVELLRAGPQASALRPSPFQSGRVFLVKDLGHCRYVLAYDLEGKCDMILAGGPVDQVPGGMSALLDRAMREALATRIERELGINTGALNGAVARA